MRRTSGNLAGRCERGRNFQRVRAPDAPTVPFNSSSWYFLPRGFDYGSLPLTGRADFSIVPFPITSVAALPSHLGRYPSAPVGVLELLAIGLVRSGGGRVSLVTRHSSLL